VLGASIRKIFSSPRPTAAALAVLLPFLICALPCSALPNHQQSQQNQSGAQEAPPPDKPVESKKDTKPSDPTTTKLRIRVTASDKPVGNASVYVRFPVAGGLFHHDKLAELNLKTNEDGSAKVPDIPRGKILIQVVAKGWKTYGKWYEINSDEQTVEIRLEPPPHWY
jgi:hypothetical protein